MRSTPRILSIFSALALWIALLCAITPAAAQQITPTPQPTRTPAELIGVDRVITTGVELWERFGLAGMFALMLLGAALFVFFGFARKTGEGLADFLFRVFLGRWFDRRVREQDQRQEERQQEQQRRLNLTAGLTAYLNWLQVECGVLPQKPLDEDDEELALEQVYVPLRVVERDQMDRFVAYRLRDFVDAEEQKVRETAFAGLAQSSGVFRLLSDRDCLPQAPDGRRRSHADETDTEHLEPTTTERLLLIGEAGSGKTTTLNFGAMMLAQDYLAARSVKARTELDLHTHKRYIPVYIKLTLLTRYLLEKYRADRSRLTNHPADLVYEWLDADLPRQDEAIPAGLIVGHLKAGDCLVLFDGLDETGDAAERDFAKGLITNLVQACPNNRYVVASRPFDGAVRGLSGFIERHLSPLNEAEMQKLLDQWFQAIGASMRRPKRRSVTQEFDELWGRLQESPRLFDMATNPLLLTSMAILVHGGDALPAERARVYDRLTKLTIVRWRDAELRRGLPLDDADRALRIYDEESDDDLRLRLQVLAEWMLKEQRREIALHDVQKELAPIYRANRGWKEEQCRNYIRRLMQSLALHSGLIQERDERYSFIHFTLQEYLAARHFDEIGDLDGLLLHWREPRWKETILLAVGHWATIGIRKRAEETLTKLIDDDDPEALLLAAEALDEANARRVVALGAILQRCTAKLRTLAALTADWRSAAHADPVLRNRAATMLDRLDADNDRAGLDLAAPDYWATPIEPGVFSMGDERNKFDYTIHQPYALARFPVTNRQYLRFLEALAGRDTPESNAAAARLLPLLTQHDQNIEKMKPRYWPGARYRAGEGNHPVVGVTWYAATAFAWWANEVFLTAEQCAAGELIRLPTEAEWERAAAYPPTLSGALRYGLRPTQDAAQDGSSPSSGDAAGGSGGGILSSGDAAGGSGGGILSSGDAQRSRVSKGAADQPTNPRAERREYPWGAELTTATSGSITASIQANTSESQIGATSVVGIFPHGAAACGAEELAGNVWEWCSTPMLRYPFKSEVNAEMLYTQNKRASSSYVLRGGSWYVGRDFARCASRRADDPDLVFDYYGFRLARSFSLSSS
jgi:formylglycine-generating enzyme required for sulfatase activity/energy-coupling factor transporter ATP-binding protein EcfA2